mmetsp:Transcript_45829/g.103515  ORF Transcript_45829/g.103515 Transcript_45829/m.103515 type:complete len:148 (-) Transcript_45829:46-489(-)
MQVDYIYDGTVLTSKPKHVGHAGERELLLAMFEATGGKSFVDPIELKKLGKEPKSNWRKTGGWDPAVEPSWHHEYMFAYHGLKLREDGHVEQILLTANGLVLTLPVCTRTGCAPFLLGEFLPMSASLAERGVPSPIPLATSSSLLLP